MAGMLNPPHPGEVLKYDVIEDAGLTVGEAAVRLGVSRVALSRVLNCHAAVSPSLAVRLEKAGAGTARMWLNLQAAYDLASAKKANFDFVQPLTRELVAA